MISSLYLSREAFKNIFVSSCSAARVNVSVAFLSFNSFTSFLNFAMTLSFSSETSAIFFESSSLAFRASSRSCRASIKAKDSDSFLGAAIVVVVVVVPDGDFLNKFVKNSC